MQLGIHLTPFFSPPERPPTQILDEGVNPTPLALSSHGVAAAIPSGSEVSAGNGVDAD